MNPLAEGCSKITECEARAEEIKPAGAANSPFRSLLPPFKTVLSGQVTCHGAAPHVS